MTLETALKVKKNKTFEDVETIKLLETHLSDAETNLPKIPTPLLMPANKIKGGIEARLARSRSSAQHVQGAEKSLSQEVDIDMERLIRAAEGPSLSREFD